MSELVLVEPDDAAYTALSGKVTDYNATHAASDRKSDLLVLVEDGTLVADGRGILDMGALGVRGSAHNVRCS